MSFDFRNHVLLVVIIDGKTNKYLELDYITDANQQTILQFAEEKILRKEHFRLCLFVNSFRQPALIMCPGRCITCPLTVALTMRTIKINF